jgi:hypothetical protein
MKFKRLGHLVVDVNIDNDECLTTIYHINKGVKHETMYPMNINLLYSGTPHTWGSTQHIM